MNNKFQIFNFKGRGFTLVETLVVGGIFTIISTIIIAILVIVLRGAKKSDSVIVVRQNGEQAMSQMVRIMRFARSLDVPCPLIDSSSITVTSVDLSQSTFTCPTVFTYPNYIDLNGAKLTNSNTVVVQSCSFVCTQSIGGSPIIGIFFTLSKVNSSGAPEGDAIIPFNSSVTLRNISSD
ncbi:hypothetical protein KKE68_00125 [Patescibacteria group bacterium]|nr:hypothetical protein [Patescibacteria group bacterium]